MGEDDIRSIGPNAKKGYILEVNLEYPAELHEEHNDFPLAPEKRKVQKEWFPPYQQKLLAELGHSLETAKLMLTLLDKEKYVVHCRNLQLYLSLGMKVKKVHRVLEFEQECWMKKYILCNTEFRSKTKIKFEQNFYKLMNSSVFGKTMENLRNRTGIKLVRPSEQTKIDKLVASPLYAGKKEFTNDLAGIQMHKSHLLLNKPVYTGMTILENSKILMYDFYYNFLKKKYGASCSLLYTDTDSFLLEIETKDVYADMAQNSKLYDTSDYPKDHPLHSEKNQKVLGKMKDETKGVPIAEAVCLRPKMYVLHSPGGRRYYQKSQRGEKKKALLIRISDTRLTKKPFSAEKKKRTV